MTTEHNGTVISGTNREDDLIPAFLNYLSDSIAAQYNQIYFDLIYDNQLLYTTDCMTECEFNIVGEILECLFEDMNEIAPTGYYFGAHTSDGSDYGFWKIEE